MKIFCIGRNYADHAAELNNAVPERPMIFMKPPTALLLDNKPFYIPEFSDNIHYEGEIVIKINKNGKYIQPAHASAYYREMAFGIDFTARDLQSQLKAAGHPWEIAKGFDNAAALSHFVEIPQDAPIRIKTLLNNEVVQEGSSDQMIFDVNHLIIYISQFFTLQKGDLIYTGTPAGVGQVKKGDMIVGLLNDTEMLQCKIK